MRGEKSYRLSGAESLIAPMLAGVPHKEFVRPSLLVKAEDLELLLGDLRSFNPDLIIAIGGGAVIDSAKALTLLARSSFSAAELPQVDLTEVDTVPLVAVPTTAGSGSEATCFAALYVEGRKYSIKAPGLLPRLAIVDSNLTHSLPAYETACSGRRSNPTGHANRLRNLGDSPGKQLSSLSRQLPRLCRMGILMRENR